MSASTSTELLSYLFFQGLISAEILMASAAARGQFASLPAVAALPP
jgi:hypothetical protein